MGEDSFYLYAPLLLATLHVAGSFEVLPEEIGPYHDWYSIRLNDKDLNKGDKSGGISYVDYEWCENTLKLKDVIQRGIGIYWDLYWERP